MCSAVKKTSKQPFVKLISVPPVIQFVSIAKKLGVSDPNELISDVVEVDQHRLELLMIMNLCKKSANYPQDFFDSVMKETSTHLIWPIPWKVNAPYNKPPYLHVIGKTKNVQNAKSLIFPVLGMHSTRVIMKFDVPHDSHSFLIGARGASIKTIKEKANIKHVHFPNYRLNPHGNNNEVTMYGSLSSVETARCLLRLSSPVIISFITDIATDRKKAIDEMIPIIKAYEIKYKVQIILYPRTKSYSILFLVKGIEKHIENMIMITKELLTYTIKWSVIEMEVQMRLQIAPQHHIIIQDHVDMIMENTKTVIKFPNLKDPTIKTRKKSIITISGSVEGVYNAKQQLIGNLPISVVFVYYDSYKDALFSHIMELNLIYKVLITLETLEKNIFIATIRGTEKHVANIYNCRQRLLNKCSEYVKPNIPTNYFPIEPDKSLSDDASSSESLSYNNSSSSIDPITDNSIQILRNDSSSPTNVRYLSDHFDQYELLPAFDPSNMKKLLLANVIDDQDNDEMYQESSQLTSCNASNHSEDNDETVDRFIPMNNDNNQEITKLQNGYTPTYHLNGTNDDLMIAQFVKSNFVETHANAPILIEKNAITTSESHNTKKDRTESQPLTTPKSTYGFYQPWDTNILGLDLYPHCLFQYTPNTSQNDPDPTIPVPSLSNNKSINKSTYKFNGSMAPGAERRIALDLKKKSN